jgi:sodium-dependent dicarboxylate transporter 2/3/5
MKLKTLFNFIITPLIVAGIYFFADLDPEKPMVTAAFCVAILMAVWWITEAVPLAVTSLLPVILFPVLGIMDGKSVASTYFNDVIFLFMGGFFIALAMEKWNLHRRIAIRILSFTGVTPSLILLGFMTASFFISMWISNTATVMMMIPIVTSVISQFEDITSVGRQSKFSTGLLLGVAYGASIGGTATLVGTPPNLSLVRIFHIYFPDRPDITFSSWLFFALPTALLVFISAWIILKYKFPHENKKGALLEKNTFEKHLQELGKMSFEEKAVSIIFTLVAVLWIFRADIDLGGFKIPGWADLFKYGKYINDGTVAMAGAVTLFLIPSKNKNRERIMEWKTASKLPWNILLLFGGGFALATGFKESGLSLWFGERLAGASDLHPFLLILCISLVMTFLTELTSNTATTEMILPVLAGISVTTGIDPLLLMIPATFSASMAFMLPVATPPNAIIFGTNRIRVRQMASVGFILNLIGAIIISAMMYFWGSVIFLK